MKRLLLALPVLMLATLAEGAEIACEEQLEKVIANLGHTTITHGRLIVETSDLRAQLRKALARIAELESAAPLKPEEDKTP